MIITIKKEKKEEEDNYKIINICLAEIVIAFISLFHFTNLLFIPS
jgi:hypothetical protein